MDEAQELTDAEWQMLLLRCPSRSFTIVGDRAQARHGFTESWQERLERVGLDRIDLASLSINYRTPEEVMAEAEPVIRAVLPDANVPTSIRSSGVPVVHGSVVGAGRDPRHLARRARRRDRLRHRRSPTFRATSRVRSLTPELSKGLEFDLVVLVDPETFGAGIEGAVDRYVAMTRATQRLVVLEGPDPTALVGLRRAGADHRRRQRGRQPAGRLVAGPRRCRATAAPRGGGGRPRVRQVVLVLEGAARAGQPAGEDGGVHTVHAPGPATTRSWSRCGSRAHDGDEVVVVTADRALRTRVAAAGGSSVGPSWLLARTS